ncbi:MAG: hypothetical protein IT384_14405 [Deltaproteobacteria bacterium]|nr:hypothetical protein [Deltaproteobacteria bacterium]
MSASLDAAAPDPEAHSSRPLALIFLALTLVSGVYGTVYWLARDRGPPPEAFPPAALMIRREWRAGDSLMLVPFYATRARELLGDLAPVAPRDPLAEDLRVHRRVWIFGLFGEGLTWRDRLPRSGLVLEEASEPSPGITVDRYRVEAPWEVTFQFRDRLRDAKVFHEHRDGQLEPCARWDEKNGQGGTLGRWLCPHDGEWFYVAPEWHRMGDDMRLCLWAHPPTEGRLLVRYAGVPLSGHLYGHAGHTLNGSIHARERIFFDVQVGEQPPQRFDLALTEHWRPIAVATATTGTATVTFAVSTPDAGANHFCFDADLRRPSR